ncbi:type 1 glutamine amidotransferase domain-containing protein [Halobacteriovorax sp. DA5]|uniref:type 1 glutamine amidotransferase domain-containing protein n=1 Tax=Halobacteriovorax sp. DA5 TaxID=2067553 RepID=UPI0018EB9D0F|nr:type 1 glutamine amidotransferase domain-containing protein [Halobacteriovorax sp. DA5]
MRMLFKISALLLTLGLGTNTLAKTNQRVLIVVTSHDKLGNTGKKTGFWLPELTHPYYELIKAGIKVDIASPQGGSAPIDMNSFAEKDSYNDRFLKDASLMAKVIRTIPLAKINPKDYAAVIYSGGSGAMWDFANNKEVNRISKELYEMGGVVSAICHGTAALSDIKLSNGKYLIDGKKFAAFTREEEALIEQLDIIPFLLEEKLSQRGGKHIYGKAWSENVIVDERLVTGQNPASAKEATLKVIELIKK